MRFRSQSREEYLQNKSIVKKDDEDEKTFSAFSGLPVLTIEDVLRAERERFWETVK